MSNTDLFGPSMLSVTVAVQAFQSLLPKLSEVRKADPLNNPDVAADVRVGEIGASALTMGVGLIASSLTQSPLPAVTGLVMAVILITVYESALRADRPLERRTGPGTIRLLRPQELKTDA